jgi:putative transposase
MENLRIPGTERYFHVFNRGVDKRKIFSNTNDYQRFVDGLYLFNRDLAPSKVNLAKLERTPPVHVRILCFCLMPNHFHLLLQALEDTGISKFMQYLGNGYTKYFNTRHERTGRLFESKYKQKAVTTTEHLLQVCRYIHLNPADLIPSEQRSRSESLDDFLRNYPWSSMSAYSNGQDVPCVDKGILAHAFNSTDTFDDFMKVPAPQHQTSTSDVEGSI